MSLDSKKKVEGVRKRGEAALSSNSSLLVVVLISLDLHRPPTLHGLLYRSIFIFILILLEHTLDSLYISFWVFGISNPRQGKSE